MEKYPRVFIPFYGDISDISFFRELSANKIPFELVTHASNEASAARVEKLLKIKVTRAGLECEGSYSNILNWVRFALAPQQEWFWLIHPSIRSFALLKKTTRKKSSEKSRFVSPVVALQYKYPITKDPGSKLRHNPEDTHYAVVDLHSSDADVESSFLVDPPFALCLNNAILPRDLQFRGYMNQIHDFKLQLFSRNCRVTTPHTCAAFFHTLDHTKVFESMSTFYHIDSESAHRELLSLQDSWEKGICTVQSALSTYKNKENLSSISINWKACLTNTPRERTVGGFKSQSYKTTGCSSVGCTGSDGKAFQFYAYQFLKDDELISTKSAGTAKGYSLHDSTFTSTSINSLPTKKRVRWADDLDTHGSIVEAGDEKILSRSQAVQASSTAQEEKQECPLPETGIRQEIISLLVASERCTSLQLPTTSSQSLHHTTIIHIIDQLYSMFQSSSWEDSIPSVPDLSEMNPYRVGIIFEEGSSMISIKWNELFCTESLHSEGTLEVLQRLFMDDRVAKICSGLPELYTELLCFSMKTNAQPFLPQNTYDISLARFYSGEPELMSAKIMKSNMEKSKSRANDNAVQQSLQDHLERFENLVRIFVKSENWDGYAALNKAAFTIRCMQISGVSFEPDGFRNAIANFGDNAPVAAQYNHSQNDFANLLASFKNFLLPEIDDRTSIANGNRIHFFASHCLDSGLVMTEYSFDSVFCLKRIVAEDKRTAHQELVRKTVLSLEKCILAPRGKALISIHFPDIDIWLFAHLSKDTRMLSLIESNIDIASFFMFAYENQVYEFSKAFSSYKPSCESEVDLDALRILIQGCIFGCSLSRIALRMQQPWEKVQSYVRFFKKLFSGIEVFFDKVAQEVSVNREVRSIFGARKCFPPERKGSENFQKSVLQAIHFMVQASIADVMNLCLVSLEELKRSYVPCPFEIVMQPREAIICYSDCRFVNYFCTAMRKALSKAFNSRKLNIACRIYAGFTLDRIDELIVSASGDHVDPVLKGIYEECQRGWV